MLCTVQLARSSLRAFQLRLDPALIWNNIILGKPVYSMVFNLDTGGPSVSNVTTNLTASPNNPITLSKVN